MPGQTQVRERFVLTGDVGAAGFPGWIDRYARKLGVGTLLGSCGPDRIEMTVDGPPDLVDAMELGCSLGPIEVWVESVDRESLLPDT